MSYPDFEKPSSEFKSYAPERDFVGYGDDSPKDCWPEGKKIYISFVLNYEEGAETSLWNGDASAEGSLHELSHARPQKHGVRDLVVESMFEYGIRSGLPRILNLFKKYSMPITLWCCPRTLETSGDPYTKIMRDAGHEFACHGSHWRRHNYFKGPDDDADHVRESLDRFQKLTGDPEAPSGWYIHARSFAHKHIRAKVHREKNIPLLYCSDSYASDLPYYIPSPLAALDGEKDEGLLMIPYTLVNNDHRFLAAGYAGTGQSDDWLDTLKADFDYLYEEGRQGRPKMMTVAFHNRIIGRPSRFAALKKFVEYVATKEDVWIATRRDAAKHWRAKYPYETVGATRDLHN